MGNHKIHSLDLELVMHGMIVMLNNSYLLLTTLTRVDLLWLKLYLLLLLSIIKSLLTMVVEIKVIEKMMDYHSLQMKMVVLN
ncbi:MAG: hypothetical protein EBR58_10390 [Betaproteobacteria bacterium]|nr:hypothetical protein [Betaproteobacteria bacterium]